MWQQPSADQTPPPPSLRTRASATNLLGSSGLPTWESFSLADRHLLIHLLVQTARRQAQGQSADRPMERG
jgi:hypothetical protein